MKNTNVESSPLSLRFNHKALENEFGLAQAERARRPTRIALLCAASITVFILWPLSFLADTAFQAQMPKIVAMVVTTAGVCYGITYLPLFLLRHQAVMFCIALLATAVTVYGSSHSPTLEASGFFLLVLHLFSIYGVFRFRFPFATLAGWASLVFYSGYMIGLGYLPERAVTRHVGALVLANLWGMLICYQMESAIRGSFLAAKRLAVEHARADELLLNILPERLARELSTTGSARPTRHESATILFTDFSGFTEAAATMPSDVMVSELNDIFGEFDRITDHFGVERIKTIGDAYMAAAGVSLSCDNHAKRCVRAGLEMVNFLEERNAKSVLKWHLRIGIHSGPVISGVVGTRKFAFDVWGDTVNVASRLERSGEIGRINVSAYTAYLIKDEFECTYRGKIATSGKGDVDMYFVSTTGQAAKNAAA